MDRLVIIACKMVVYSATVALALAILFRGIVPFLWGAGTALGMLGAVVCGVLGFVAVVWLAYQLGKNVLNTK
jgi:hypothetical protein